MSAETNGTESTPDAVVKPAVEVPFELSPEKATGDLPKELIFWPFAYVLLQDELHSHCWYCLAEPGPGVLKRCTGCSQAYFCGKQCQTLGWTDHKPECKGLAKGGGAAKSGCSTGSGSKSGSGRIPDVEVRMLGRVAHRYLLIEEGKDQRGDAGSFYFQRSSERKVMDIWSHTTTMRKDAKAWRKFQDIYVKLQVFYEAKFLPSSEATMFELHCRNYINRHAINDPSYMREIGKGLYLDLCAYDHSCAPTAIYICQGLRAHLRPLKEGIDLRDKTQTFYTYIDLLNTKQERQEMLLDSWYFTCQCTRCLDPTEHMLTAIRCEECEGSVPLRNCLTKSSRKKGEPVVACLKCGTVPPTERIASCSRLIAEMISITQSNQFARCTSEDELTKLARSVVDKYTEKIPTTNIYFVRLLQMLIGVTDPESWPSLLYYHLAALPAMRICFPRNHPALAYHLLNLGIFLTKLDRPVQAKVNFEEARQMMSKVFDPGHHMLQVLKEYYP